MQYFLRPAILRRCHPTPAVRCDFPRKYVYNPSDGAQNSSQERNLDLGGSKSAPRPRRVAKNDLLQNPSENATFSRFRTVRQTLRPAMNESSAGRFWLTFSTKHVISVDWTRAVCRRREGDALTAAGCRVCGAAESGKVVTQEAPVAGCSATKVETEIINPDIKQLIIRPLQCNCVWGCTRISVSRQTQCSNLGSQPAGNT